MLFGLTRAFLGAALAATLVLAVSTGVEAQSGCRGCIPVELTSSPPGATVYLDSVSDAQRIGVTPKRWARIPRGQHTFIFQLENHEEHREAANVNNRLRRRTINVQLNPLGRIQIASGNPDTEGAPVHIDGQPVGTVPFEATLQPGRHEVRVSREGFVTYSQWVDLAGAQVRNLSVSLEREATRTGRILVAGDVSGAIVLIDGEEVGQTPMVVENIHEGEHLLEVRAPAELGLEPHSEQVRVIAGERISVIPRLRPEVTTGSLRVISNAPGAIVMLDGVVVGEAPATRDDVTPGEHIVEVSAAGFLTAQQPVTVEVGLQRVISVTLEAVQLEPGRIVINSSTAGATVTIDGEDRGPVPVVVAEIEAGAHSVIVRADGHDEFRQTCTTAPGQDCAIDADLGEIGAPVSVRANLDSAEFVVDGEVRGPLPWEGTIPVGAHVFEVRALGYHSAEEQVSLEISEEVRQFEYSLIIAPDEEELARRRRVEEREDAIRYATSWSATPVPNNVVLSDFYVGWPYALGARLSIGILDHFEAGVTVQTTGSGRLTEIAGRFKGGWRVMDQISIGGQFTIGGGVGPTRGADESELGTIDPEYHDNEHAQNTFFTSIDLLGTLHFGEVGSFTLDIGVDFISDQYDWCGSNSNILYTDAGCGGHGFPLLSYQRQNQTRVRIEGILEILAGRKWSIFASFGGAVVGDPRRVMGDVYGLGNEDIMIYARGGVTWKIGSMD